MPQPLLALLDTGADACFCSTNISSWLGINYTKCKKEKFISINNDNFFVYKTKLTFYFNKEEFTSPIYISDTLPKNFQIVLGTKGFLERYKVILDYKNKEIKFY